MNTPSATNSSIPEKFDDVIREYIDFVNSQVGMYMDALAGLQATTHE